MAKKRRNKNPTELQKKAMEIRARKIQNNERVVMGDVMLEAGYAPSMAKNSQYLTESQGWKILLARVDDKSILDRLNEIAMDGKDKRACLQAIDMILKLKGRYAKQSAKILGLFGNL